MQSTEAFRISVLEHTNTSVGIAKAHTHTHMHRRWACGRQRKRAPEGASVPFLLSLGKEGGETRTKHVLLSIRKENETARGLNARARARCTL